VQLPPPVPLNLVGDFGGGGMLMAFGVACALVDAGRTGQGQVIDAAMVDGSAILMTMMWGFRALGIWGPFGTNVLDTGAPFYDTYETSDGKFIALGSLEPQFYAELIARLGLTDDVDTARQMDQSSWPELRERLTALFKTKTRDEWSELLEMTDACFAPVLTMGETVDHPHIKARGTIVDANGMSQPAPAPRFSRTPGQARPVAAAPGEDGAAALADWGWSADAIAGLRRDNIV